MYVIFWCWRIRSIEVLPNFCLKLSSKRKKLKVWSNLSGEETVFMSDFCPWQNDCQILLIFCHSLFTESPPCNTFFNYYIFPTKILHLIVFYKQAFQFLPFDIDVMDQVHLTADSWLALLDYLGQFWSFQLSAPACSWGIIWKKI